MTRPPDDFAGSVVVTGASSGIGRATAIAFAERGADVVVAARSEDSLRAVAQTCEAAGARALAVPTDVSDEQAVQQLARRAAARFSRIDVWVNNAAVMVYGRFEEIPGDVHRHVIETNLFGQIHGARAVLPYFHQQGRGVLINVDSLYARMTSPYVSAYVASKYGVRGFSEVLRQELRTEPGIHVSVILPASVDTPIFRHAGNYTGRRLHPIPPVVDPHRVVRAILRSAHDPQKEQVVGAVGDALSWGHAIFPKLYDAVVVPVMNRVGFRAADTGAGPGNVLEPMPEWNQVSGHWRRSRETWLRRSALAAGAGVLTVVAARRRRR